MRVARNSRMSDAERVTAAEIARGLGGRPVGRGWVARCPAHDDGARPGELRHAEWKEFNWTLPCGAFWPRR